jgi:hypothetical protein
MKDTRTSPVMLFASWCGASLVASGIACGGDPSSSAPGAGPSEPSMSAGDPLSPGSGTPGSSRPYVAAPPAPAALPARVWRLTHAEYARSVEALVGRAVDTEGFALELDSGLFRNLAEVGFVRDDLAADYAEGAEQVTDALTAAELGALVPCGRVESECAAEFIETMASRAYRRPARPEDVARYQGIFDLGSSLIDVEFGFRSVLRALLSSPYFLYRTEVGPAEMESAAQFSLTDYELASFLSFSLLGQPPDEALLDRASRGELSSPQQLPEVVGALLDQPQSAEQLRKFLLEWLEVYAFDEVDKFATAYPGFDDVRALIAAETQAFLDAAGGPNATLQALLQNEVPSMGSELDAFYYSDPSSSGAETRVGLMALGTVLSQKAKPNLTSPTLRGLFIRSRLLCQTITFPPGLDIPPLPESDEEEPKTTRELYALHAGSAVCAGCHALTDGIGFMFEGLDGAGRHRSREHGFPVDTVSDLVQTDVDGTYADYRELAQALGESDWVRECLAAQAFRFYFGQPEPARGIPPIQQGYAALSASGDLKGLVRSLMSSESSSLRSRE